MHCGNIKNQNSIKAVQIFMELTVVPALCKYFHLQITQLAKVQWLCVFKIVFFKLVLMLANKMDKQWICFLLCVYWFCLQSKIFVSLEIENVELKKGLYLLHFLLHFFSPKCSAPWVALSQSQHPELSLSFFCAPCFCFPFAFMVLRVT